MTKLPINAIEIREREIRKDEWEKLLDELDNWADELPPYSGKDMPKVLLKLKIEELRRRRMDER